MSQWRRVEEFANVMISIMISQITIDLLKYCLWSTNQNSEQHTYLIIAYIKYCGRCVCVMSSDSAHRLKKNICRVHTYEYEAKNIYIYMFHQSTSDLRLSWRVRIVFGGWSKVRERQTEKDKKKTLAPKSNSRHQISYSLYYWTDKEYTNDKNT